MAQRNNGILVGHKGNVTRKRSCPLSQGQLETTLASRSTVHLTQLLDRYKASRMYQKKKPLGTAAALWGEDFTDVPISKAEAEDSEAVDLRNLTTSRPYLIGGTSHRLVLASTWELMTRRGRHRVQPVFRIIYSALGEPQEGSLLEIFCE